MNCLFAEKELFETDGSIEHIYPESYGKEAYNIGNLILLELNINNEAGQVEYREKLKKYYNKSQYKWISLFIEKNPEWNENMISSRAEELAEIFYNSILRRE